MNDAPDVTGLGEVEYAENGDAAVATTYTAVDPDGSEIVSWSLMGADADDFKIEDGVLNFKKAPDYETPKGGGQDMDDMDNIYEVTVEATDATKRVGKKDVTVEVTNVEEGGSMRLSAVQPQAATGFYVIDEEDATGTQISDPDGITSSIKWQWSKSRSKTTGFRDIDKATNPAYTPKDTDNGYYLRVTASYTDREGPDKSAQATSSYPVQLAPGNNVAPKFADDQDPDMEDEQPDAARSIAENTPKGVDIGSPIEASDLNPGKLTYTLEGQDAALFDIDRETGQLKTKTVLDVDEDGDLSDRDVSADGFQLEVMVRATDPSGDPQVDPAVDTNSDIVTVDITVEDLAEDPQIDVPEGEDNMLGGFEENTETTVVTFTAVVEEGSVSRWSLAGPDAGKLEFANDAGANDAGALTFKDSPDYEMPGDADGDNMYEVTVRATDSDGRTGTKDVTVKVTNMEEDGVVTLSPTQHRAGVPITATLKDDDGGVYGLMWQWSTATGDISGATSDTYTPKVGDINGILNAVATYHDAAGEDMADTMASANTSAVLRDTRNKAPVFKDSKGVVITQAERSVAETATGDMADDTADDSSDNVGGTIRAEDSNIGDDAEDDSLAFSLSGSDASKFRIRQPASPQATAAQDVQVEVKSGAKFDFETKDTYVVTLTATDEYGETADLELTIKITDVNEAPEIMAGGLAISGMTRIMDYAENGTGMVAMYTASGPDADMAMWSLGGDDAGQFSIANGMLMFMTAPDYEMPMDADMDNEYMVTVMADDGTNMDTQDVTVTVTNVDEDGDGGRCRRKQPRVGTADNWPP